MSRVSVGVGSKVQLTLVNPVARMVSLAGAQLKFELTHAITGTISKVNPNPVGQTSEGKPDYEFEVTLDSGEVVKTQRSNIEFCVHISG